MNKTALITGITGQKYLAIAIICQKMVPIYPNYY